MLETLKITEVVFICEGQAIILLATELGWLKAQTVDPKRTALAGSHIHSQWRTLFSSMGICLKLLGNRLIKVLYMEAIGVVEEEISQEILLWGNCPL